MKTVAIVQRVLPHYRVPLFRKLHANLRVDGIELRVIYGHAAAGTVPKTVEIDERWAWLIKNSYLRLGNHELVWQPCWSLVRDVDLVIVEQANRLVVNHALLATRALGQRRRIAFWGHGRNHQATSSTRFSEALKTHTSARVDWWFAYTDASAATVVANGTPKHTITVVNNSIETADLVKAATQIGEADLSILKERIGIAQHAFVGLFCGGMYRGKSLDFLLDAAHAIRGRIPTFELVLIGDGPDQRLAAEAMRQHGWIHYVGPIFGEHRAPYFRLADLMLIPSEVGLVIIDSFATRTPLFTTRTKNHGPELTYLVDGQNGIVTEPDVEAYANAVEAYYRDEQVRRRLTTGCGQSAERYTLDHMVCRFASGIRQCLDA